MIEGKHFRDVEARGRTLGEAIAHETFTRAEPGEVHALIEVPPSEVISLQQGVNCGITT